MSNYAQMKCAWMFVAMLLPIAAVADPKPARIAIHVTEKGFEPASITVPAKAPVMLVFQRDTDATCTKSVVIKLDDGKRIERALPLNKPVEIAVTFPKAGTLGYACSMNMNKGTIVVQ
jgi:plastocyanin domain-containing protein